MTKIEMLDLLNKALAAADSAATEAIRKNPEMWFPCGFSWVRIKPARGKFVELLKELRMGSTSSEGGYMIYNPSGNYTQWMDAKHEGSKAFAQVLNDAGIKCYAESRMD